MRSQLVGPFLERVSAAGARPDAILRELGLPAEAEHAGEVELRLSTLQAFFEAVERASGDPFVGLHVAGSLPRGTYGLVEYGVRSAPNVRGALERLSRYITLLNDLVVISFDEREGAGVVEQRIPGVPAGLGRQGNEFFVAGLLLQGRLLSGVPFVPLGAWFAHPAPPDVSKLVALLGTDRISFSAGANGLSLASEVLDLPFVTSDPPLLQLLDQKFERALARRARPTRLIERVERRLRDRLMANEPTGLEPVAEALKMSARTLQRRLADEGVTFAQLADDARRELACRYVKDGTRPLGEVAYLLGYNEMSAFFHAFKRWTGTTPSKFRDGS
jgi:AraC-like DNA-binding protein